LRNSSRWKLSNCCHARMKNITSSKLLYAKAILFVVLGTIASALLIFESPSLRIVILLSLAIWSFCRAYYFVFYVIQHYVDGEYRFSGLGSFVNYVLRQHDRNTDNSSPTD
jgi:hypothetical protein